MAGRRNLSRRAFLKEATRKGATLIAASALGWNYAWAQGSDRIRVGLVGCGGRGTGAARDCVSAADGVEIWALGDLFQDRLDSSRRALSNLGNKSNVTDSRCFVGFDAYKRVIDSGVDLVLLTTPPGFRPIHFKAAVEAGKHVFMEKPVAVCPTGVRMIIESSKVADQKKLGVLAGTQYRHHEGYIETIKRIHGGAIGTVLAAYAYFLTGELWKWDRQPGMSEIEWQIRNWLYFNWLSGDHIVEQFVHNIDVMNWVMGSPPSRCIGMGGRQSRIAPEYGHIYDHFAIEYVYPNGARVTALCRQMGGCANRVTNQVIGSEGQARLEGFETFWVRGKETWRWQGSVNPYVQEHANLIASVRAGKPINEGVQVAESTLTAIMGRMAAYTGQEVTWDFVLKESKLNLVRNVTAFGEMPVDEVAIPGKTPLV